MLINQELLTGKDITQKNRFHQGTNTVGVPIINQSDIPRLKKGGFTCVAFATTPLEIKQNKHIKTANDPLKTTLYYLRKAHKWIRKYPQHFTLIQNINDISTAKINKKIGIILSLEGANAIEEDIDTLYLLYKLGVRMISFTWNFDNKLGTGAATKTKKGLSSLGKKAVKIMNKIGITIDVVHTSKRSFYDILETTYKPVVCSHSNLAHFNKKESWRIMTNKQLKMLAQNGGVLGLSAHARFLSENHNAKLTDYIKQLKYAVELVGVDYIGIGTDFDGMTSTPQTKNLKETSDIPNITKELIKSGWSDFDIKKFLGLNYLRIFSETW